MSIDAHIPSSTAQALPFSVRDMLLCFRIAVLFRHTEVHNMDGCTTIVIQRTKTSQNGTRLTISAFGPRSTNQEVVWLDVSVDEILLVNGLHSRKLTE